MGRRRANREASKERVDRPDPAAGDPHLLEKQILERMAEGVMLARAGEGTIVYVSGPLARMLGYDDPDELMGRRLEDVSPEDDQVPRLGCGFIARMLEHSPRWAGDVKLTRRDGSIFEGRTSVSQVTCAPHEQAWLLVVRESRTLEPLDRLQWDFEARWRTLLENVPDFISVHDVAGRILLANRLLEMLPAEATWGKSMREFVPKGQRQIIDRAIRTVIETRQATSYEVWTDLPDGVPRWFACQLGPILHGQTVVGLILIATDITQRRKTEQALRQSEAQFRLLAENATDIITRTLPDGRYAYVSPAVRDVMGYTPDELMRMSALDLIHPDDRPRVQQAMQAAFEGDAGPGSITYRAIHRDGHEVWLESRGRLITDPKTGQVVELQGASRDVTAQVQAEEQARVHQAELAHVWRLGVMGELATTLAHELNQPLTAIINYLESIARRMREAGMDPDGSQDDLALAIREAQRAGQIIHQLRDFVRKRGPRRTAVELHRLIAQTAELIAAEARRHQVRLTFRLASEPLYVTANEVQVQQVLLNMMRNAIEAMTSVPGEVPGDLPGELPGAREIIVETRGFVGEMHQVAVYDRGAGLPEGDADRIFAPFYTTKANGMGMGLAISRSIIEAHGGQMWVQRREGGGTILAFTLPTRRRPEAGVS